MRTSGSFEGVHKIIEAFSVTSANVTKELLQLVSPYWVAMDAAGRLPALLKRTPRVAAAINGQFVTKFTAERYVVELTRLSFSIGQSRSQVVHTTSSSPTSSGRSADSCATA